MKTNLKEVVRNNILAELGSFMTALPVKVVAYDEGQQTVDVLPLINTKFDDAGGVVRSTLLDLPVIFPSAGGGIITFPIKAGNTGLAIFCSRSIDNWTYGDGSPITPKTRRINSINDGVFFPGMYTVNTHLNPDPDNVEIKFAGSSIKIAPDGVVTITAPTINAQCSTMNVSGNLNVSGNVDISGDASVVGTIDTTTAVTKNDVPYTHP